MMSERWLQPFEIIAEVSRRSHQGDRLEEAIRFNRTSPNRREYRSRANDRNVYVEQSTGNREHDDRVRWLKVEALHAYKCDFVRRPGDRA